MALFPNNVIKTAKQVVDVTAILTKGTAELLAYTELQHKNQFEIILYPDMSGGGLSTAKAIKNAIGDSLITKLYVQTIEATFVAFTYERADNKQYIKDVEYPESITMTFLEDEFGTVRDYINNWVKSIATIDDSTGMFVFDNDQRANKRNAIVTPLGKSGLPSGAWVQFNGLKYMSMEPITFDQASPENMMLSVTFACDNCWWKTPPSLSSLTGF